MHSCLSEFNEEAFRKGIHDEGYSEGFDNGFLDAIIKFIQKSQSKDLSINDTIPQVMEYFELSKEAASELVNKHWK